MPTFLQRLALLVVLGVTLSACGDFGNVDDFADIDTATPDTSVVVVDAGDTKEGVSAAHGGDVVVWRPEAGFAILRVGTVAGETQVAQSGALRAWAGALRAWAGGELSEGGAVLTENAAIWERLSLGVAHKELAPKLGKGVVVAVIDTGIDTAHPIFEKRLDERANWYDFVEGDTMPTEVGGAAYGHGTAVASIVLQVAPEATLMPLRVLNGDGRGSVANVAAALDWAVARGADIVQLSLGTEAPAEAIEQMVRYAASQGVYVVASAGNSDGAPTYPAYSAMLATPTGDMAVGVGSVNLNDQKSRFSNFISEEGSADDGLEMVSFGEDVYAAFPGRRVAAWDGTSMAAPMVAGALALALGEGAESLNPRQLGLKVVSSALEIDAEGDSRGQEFDLEQRLEIGLFLCDALNLDAAACAGAFDDANDDEDDEDDGDDNEDDEDEDEDDEDD